MSLWKTLQAAYNGSGDTAKVRIDASTSSLQFVDYEHHEIHSGSHFTYSYTDTDFDIADTVELLIITPNTTKWAHLIFDVEAALDTTVDFYETSTHGSSAVLTPYNNNRNSATANTTTINTSDDAGADGTLIFSSAFGISTGGGANQITGGGQARGDSEWILKQNTKYLLRVATGTDNSVLSIKLSWYEHTDHN